jgi:hypothetical protein
MRYLVLALSTLLFVSCGGGDSSSETTTENVVSDDATSVEDGNQNAEYWGSWKDVESGEEIYITSKTVSNIEKVDERLIKIENSYYLRSGARNVQLKGSLYTAESRETKGLGDVASIEVIFKNLKDSNIQTTVNSDDSGDFQNSDLPTGTYELTAQSGDLIVTSEVELVKDSEDIGSFKLVDSSLPNFKVELILNQDSSTLYADGNEYSGTIRIYNIGSSVARGLVVTHGVSEIYETEESVDDIISNSFEEIETSFEFGNYQNRNVEYHNLVVTIKDEQDNEWNEEITLPVHKGNFELSFKSQDSIRLQGVLTSPNGISTYFDSKETNFELPLLNSDEQNYTISFVNYSRTDGFYYSLALNSKIEELESLDKSELINFVIGLDEVRSSWLSVGDLDTWIISTKDTETSEETGNATGDTPPSIPLEYATEDETTSVAEDETTSVAEDETTSVAKDETTSEAEDETTSEAEDETTSVAEPNKVDEITSAVDLQNDFAEERANVAMSGIYTVKVTVQASGDKEWDILGNAPDISAAIIIGKETIYLEKKQDSYVNSKTFSAYIEGGIAITITAYDEDIQINDRIGAGSFEFDGESTKVVNLGSNGTASFEFQFLNYVYEPE